MSIENTLYTMEQTARSQNPFSASVYTIQRGDTLSHILSRHYKIAANGDQYKVAEAFALYFNPSITHPSNISAGKTIRLMPLPKPSAFAYCPVPDDFHDKIKLAKTRHRLEPLHSHPSAQLRDRLPPTREERELFYALARAQDKYNWLGATGMGFAAFEHIAGPGNRALIAEIGDTYQQYKDGKLTKGQYDGRRAKNLKQVSKNLSHLQRFLFDGQTANEAIRINRKKSLPATGRITNNISKLSNLSKLASRGGVILTGVGGAIACENIGNAETREEKNEIFVEFIGGAATSTITGVALGVLFATTPVGWATALVIGGATVVAGWAGGKVSKNYYDNNFSEVDLVKSTNIDRWCN